MTAPSQRASQTSRTAVIGSGAAGMACAMALVERGCEVTVFDGGERLEPDREKLKWRMASQRPAQWAPSDVQALHGLTRANSRGIPKKLAFGSDYPFRDPHRLLDIQYKKTELLYSLAEGGLTTMWGANILPWKKSDFVNWPIQLSDLEPHYRNVLRFMPLAAAEDDLAEEYPLYCDRPDPLQMSRQSRELLQDMNHARQALRLAGMTFGGGRLAVRTARPDAPTSGCEYCGQCLYGCPYSHIYSAASTLEMLVAKQAIRHESGVYVEKFEDKGQSVHLTCRPVGGSEVHNLEFDRIFIAAGVLPTARLVLHSLGAYETPVVLKDSQYFLVPYLRWKGTRGVRTEALYTLTQLVLEITDSSISRRGVHLQFYSYTDIYEQVLTQMAPWLTKLAPRAIENALSRLFILQGYLHSDDSSTLTVTLNRGSDDKLGTLQLASNHHRESAGIIRAVMRKLLRHAGKFRGAPAWPMLEIAPVGKSYHCAGSFPMAEAPGPLQTDRLGRLGGAGRVHVVDASVLPNVAATTLTFTAMANAHRIGSEVADKFQAMAGEADSSARG